MGQNSKRAFRLATACVALAASASGGGVMALDRQKALTQLVFDSWRTEDGLPQSAVHAIHQSRDGFLWAGTEAGLVRFNGVDFKVYDTSNTPGLRNDTIWALAEDRDGTLWIGTYGGGLTRMRDGAFTALTAKEGLPNDSVRALYADRFGALWVGTDHARAMPARQSRSTRIDRMSALRSGSVWQRMQPRWPYAGRSETIA